MRRKTKEQYIKEKVDKHIELIKRDLEEKRHITAILGTIGIIYESEHEIAMEYLKELL